MSEITDQIEGYAAQRTPEAFDALKQFIVNHNFGTPQRYVNRPTDPADLWHHIEAQEYGDDGTWDEVVIAGLNGLLSPDEEYALGVAFDEAHPKPAPQAAAAKRLTLEEELALRRKATRPQQGSE